MNQDAIKGIGEALGRARDLTYEQAWSMPREFYVDPAILKLEREHLFGREWICVGRAEELPAPGDFVALEICDEPVVLIHGEDGVVRAFSNVCRHRGTIIATGKGNRRRHMCPYHNWVYDSRGRLVGTPGLGERPDFAREECGLPEFRLESWLGFLFVSLDSAAPSLVARLGDLEAKVQRYHLEEMSLKYLADEVWETNWKCLVENFMEGYHLTPVHRETLHRVNPTKLCRHFEPGEAYFGYNAGFSPDLPRSQKGHPDLLPEEIDNCVMFAVPPGLVVGCAGDYSSFLCIQPRSIGTVAVKLGLIFFGPDWPQERVDWAVELFQRTMAEDKTVLKSLRIGLNSRFHRPGPLAPADFEGPTWDFYNYLDRRLGKVLRSLGM